MAAIILGWKREGRRDKSVAPELPPRWEGCIQEVSQGFPGPSSPVLAWGTLGCSEWRDLGPADFRPFFLVTSEQAVCASREGVPPRCSAPADPPNTLGGGNPPRHLGGGINGSAVRIRVGVRRQVVWRENLLECSFACSGSTSSFREVEARLERVGPGGREAK